MAKRNRNRNRKGISLSDPDLSRMMEIHILYSILVTAVKDEPFNAAILNDAQNVCTVTINDLAKEYSKRFGPDKLEAFLADIPNRVGVPVSE
jgi:hypothetical protein